MNLVLRLRYVVGAVAGAFFAAVTRTTPPDAVDFARAGSHLLHGRLAEVYAESWNQAGPAQLLISRALMLASEPDGTPTIPLAAVVGAILVAGTMWLCRDSFQRELLAGGLALIWVTAPLPWNGHPAEILIPLLCAYVIKQSRRNQDLAAATLLALAVAIAPWAILSIPCLLAAAPLRRALPFAALAAALGAAAYVPFLLTGHFAMFAHHWQTTPGTLPSLLGLTTLTWAYRLPQAAVTATLVALTAHRCRSDPRAPAMVPLAAALLRITIDGVYYPYYFFPVAVASLLLIASVPPALPAAPDQGLPPRAPQGLLAAGALGYLGLLAESADWFLWGSLGCLGLLLLVIGRSGATFSAA